MVNITEDMDDSVGVNSAHQLYFESQRISINIDEKTSGTAAFHAASWKWGNFIYHCR